MKLDLVCDVSGSMAEGGRPFAMRTAVLTVGQLAGLGHMRAELALWGWSSDVRAVPDWVAGDDFPPDLLSCTGAANGDALIKWTERRADRKLVLFTDGYWFSHVRVSLNRLRQHRARTDLRIIKVGADSNPQLDGADVFHQEDIFVAFDEWMGSDTP